MISMIRPITPIIPRQFPAFHNADWTVLLNMSVILLVSIFAAFCISRYAANKHDGNKSKTAWLFIGITALVTMALFCFFGCAATTIKGIILCLILAFCSYSSSGKVNGIKGNVDMNYAYIDYPTLIKNSGKNGFVAVSAPKPTTNPAPAKKTNEQIAEEVLDGLWGNGTERKNKLTAAGYDYNAIQTIVNSKAKKNNLKSTDEIAREVIRGLWGNGQDRVKKLKAAGYNPKVIQDRVNELV